MQSLDDQMQTLLNVYSLEIAPFNNIFTYFIRLQVILGQARWLNARCAKAHTRKAFQMQKHWSLQVTYGHIIKIFQIFQQLKFLSKYNEILPPVLGMQTKQC